jgi:Ca2+/H+ antiporter
MFLAVLLLGMCFFAGGLRFSEQGFGQSKHLLASHCCEMLILAVMISCRATQLVFTHH